ncbi:Ig-like domain-containing protein, partial [Mesorhizobium australafricanum]
MTNNIEFDAVSNSWDEHTSAGENPISAGVQVAQAASGQAASEPVPVDVGSGAPRQGAANAQGANQPAADAKAPASNAPANAPAANAAAANAPHEYHVEAGNVVKLPASVSIDNIKVDGHDLVLTQPDGSEIVIKDAALNVPTFILGDVEVPRVALIAALEASHIDVAFGADGSISAGGNGSPGSAGGNFEHPAGGIGDGFGLTSLLPPTDLAFGQPDHRELFPGLLPDSTPTILDLTPSIEGGDTSVDEKGLETAGATGSGEAFTSAAVDDDPSEHNTGTFTINSPDGIGSLTINGQVISGADLANSANQHVSVTTPDGTLTITGYDAATGQVSYTYTLLHSVQHPAGDGPVYDNMTVIVTDSDGDVSLPGTLSVQIVDDVPTAHADVGSVPAGSQAAITGDVFVNDVFGADGKDAAGGVVGVAKGTTNANLDDTGTLNVGLHGAYGTLTLHADGSYSYVRDAGSPGGVSDVFTYTIKDGDGDLANTTLTISIGDGTPHIDSIPTTGGADTTVYEAGLGTRGSEPAGSHTGDAAYPTTVSGAVDITSPDGVAAVSLQGVTIASTNALSPTTVISDSTGTLTAWYEATSATTGHIHYTYTLLDNTGDTNNTSIPVSIGVTDNDGDPASGGNLTITIVDDVPHAYANAGSVAEGGTVGGNVLTDGTADVFGADGKDAGGGVVGVAAGSDTSNPVSGGLGGA